jgi:Na+/H+-translocating membrane pyrophosphatase
MDVVYESGRMMGYGLEGLALMGVHKMFAVFLDGETFAWVGNLKESNSCVFIQHREAGNLACRMT